MCLCSVLECCCPLTLRCPVSSATSPYVTTSYTAPTQQRQVTSAKVHTPTQNSQSYVYATNSAAQAPSGGSSYNTGSTTSSTYLRTSYVTQCLEYWVTTDDM